MLTEGLKELHIISNQATAMYVFGSYLAVTVLLITLGIVAYDAYMKKHPYKKK